MSQQSTSSANFSYKESDTGFLMSSGYNYYGGLGNTTRVNVGEAFALYKEGDSSQPFVDVVDYSINEMVSGVIDSTGKLYTAGFGNYGALGNGYAGNTSYTDQDGNKGVAGYLGDYGSGNNQYTFQQVLTAKDVLDANKANALPDNYQAVAVSTGYTASVILLNDGTLYGAGQQYSMGLGTTSMGAQTHFTRLDGRVTGLPAATSSNKIKDIYSTSGSSWVLYENGELYMTAGSSTYSGQYHLVASDIKFFDIEYTGRVYMVNTSNQILYCTETATTLETLVAEPNGIVTQVRGSYSGGWGYLNSNNELYLSTTTTDGEINVPGASNSTATGTTFYKMDNVAFFDIGGASSYMTYGVMYTNGAITVWGDNRYGQLGNGSVGNGDTTDPDYVPSNPESGLKDDVFFDEIPDVESEDGSSKPTEIAPIKSFPPATF